MAVNNDPYAGAERTDPRRAGQRGAGPAARRPTPEQNAEAARQANQNPVTARWNGQTGQYEYVPLEGQEANAWYTQQANRQTQGVQANAPAAPVDPTQAQQPGAPRPTTFDTAVASARQTQPRAPAQPALAQPGAPRAVASAPRAQPAGVGFTAPATAGPAAQQQQGWSPVQGDTSRYDAEAGRLRELQTTFLDQLGRLSQADPFGNQAALQKATDRAVSQAAGTAAGARGGAAAQVGAQRQAVGIQAQTAARGAQDIVEQRRRDEQQATGLGLQAISGAAGIGQQLTQNELALGDQAIKAAEVNLRGYLGGQELGQRERESLRQFAVEASKIDMQRYQTDMQYRAEVDKNLTARFVAGTQLEGILKQVQAGEDIGAADWLMGAVGLATGGASAAALASDERVKTNIRRPSTKALREFVERGEGKLYEYIEPDKPGRRPGENFGPMAQDLAQTEIGRTLVKRGPDGRTLMVDAARLAMADHSALTHLAKRLNRLERGTKGGRRGSR
jgi:hypothetical protein